VPLLNPPDILPEAMRFLLRTLLAHKDGACDKDELLALVAPSGLAEALKGVEKAEAPDPSGEKQSGGQVIVQKSFDALTMLGFCSLEDGRVYASSLTRQLWRTVDGLTALSFARQLRARVWQVEDSDQGGTRTNDLVAALGLMHATRDPLKPFFFEDGPGRRFDVLQADRYGKDKDAWPVGNRWRWVPARRWAIYLGMGRPTPAPPRATGLLADASRALAEDLDSVEPTTYAINAFIAQCALAVPICDTGRFSKWTGIADAEVSPGLSLSLRQLEIDGHLTLERQSDTDGMTVALGSGSDSRDYVTHVRWHPASSDRRGRQ